MAQIPQYISQSPIEPAINKAYIDPSTAAAPYQAAEQSTAHLMNILQKELGAWGETLRASEAQDKQQQQKQQKVNDGLYKAQAMAELSVQANDLYNRHKMTTDGTKSFAGSFDQDFQKLADRAIGGAPSDSSKLDLTKRLIGMRADFYKRASTESLHLNNQINMDKLENMLGTYEALAAANPAAVPTIKKQAADVFASMGELGIPETARAKILHKFDNRLEYHALRAEADRDPLGTLQKLQSGGSANLGEGNTQALMNYTKAAVGAGRKQSKQGIDSLISKISSGYILPEDYETTLAQAEKYGLSKEVSTASSLLELGRKTANSTYSDLQLLSDQLQSQAAAGGINADPSQVKTYRNFLKGNAAAIQQDALGYAERRGGFTPLPPMDILKATPEDIEQRKFKAAQVSTMYRVSASALKADELQALSSQLQDSDPDTAVTIISKVAALGGDTSRALAETLEKKDPGLAVAVEAGIGDPTILRSVLQGRALGKTSKADPVDAETLNKAQEGFLVSNPKLRAAYLESAKALMVSEAASGRSMDFEDAVAKVANIITVDNPGVFSGGYKTQAPVTGMNATQFEDFLNKNLVSDQAWSKYGNGIPVDAHGDPLTWKRIAPADLTYAFLGNGNYAVLYENAPVKTETGDMLMINLKVMAETEPK